MSSEQAFFAYARRREMIRHLRASGVPAPWTSDPVLQEFRFCNVFREDDTVTRWLRERVTTENFGYRVLGAFVIARWFNRVETLEYMLGDGTKVPYFLYNLLYSWGGLEEEATETSLDVWADLMRERLYDVKPLVTGAYMIKTPAGMNKLEGLISVLRPVLKDAVHLQVRMEPETTLQGVWEVLKEYPYLGDFMAYEVVTDLRHALPVLREAPDIMTWANPGPGCARGLDRVMQRPLGTSNRANAADRTRMIDEMIWLLNRSLDSENWPDTWPTWELRDVEHTLCEFDKYERARLGEGRPKQLFRNGATT